MVQWGMNSILIQYNETTSYISSRSSIRIRSLSSPIARSHISMLVLSENSARNELWWPSCRRVAQCINRFKSWTSSSSRYSSNTATMSSKNLLNEMGHGAGWNSPLHSRRFYAPGSLGSLDFERWKALIWKKLFRLFATHGFITHQLHPILCQAMPSIPLSRTMSNRRIMTTTTMNRERSIKWPSILWQWKNAFNQCFQHQTSRRRWSNYGRQSDSFAFPYLVFAELALQV